MAAKKKPSQTRQQGGPRETIKCDVCEKRSPIGSAKCAHCGLEFNAMFDHTRNGGRRLPKLVRDECPADNPKTGWPCIFAKKHPGKHCDIYGKEWK